VQPLAQVSAPEVDGVAVVGDDDGDRVLIGAAHQAADEAVGDLASAAQNPLGLGGGFGLVNRGGGIGLGEPVVEDGVGEMPVGVEEVPAAGFEEVVRDLGIPVHLVLHLFEDDLVPQVRLEAPGHGGVLEEGAGHAQEFVAEFLRHSEAARGVDHGAHEAHLPLGGGKAEQFEAHGAFLYGAVSSNGTDDPLAPCAERQAGYAAGEVLALAEPSLTRRAGGDEEVEGEAGAALLGGFRLGAVFHCPRGHPACPLDDNLCG
jgi:hypothetical protein